MTLSVFDAAREEPERKALIDGAMELSFAELAARVARRTAELARARALDPAGERAVAVVAFSSLETIETLLALFAAGTPVLVLHPRSTGSERRALIERTGALLEPPRTPEPSSNPPEPARFDPERIAAIVPTSGSSGEPRLVRLSHRAVLAAARASAEHLGVEADDRWLLALPLAHVAGLSILARCLVARRTVVLLDSKSAELPPDARARALATAVSKHAVTLVSLVPTLLERLLDEPGFDAPPKLRAVLLGGAPVARSLVARAHERRVPILTTYGLSETCAQVATRAYAERFQPPHLELEIVPSGVPLPGVSLRIVNGALEVAGPTLFSGYVGEPGSAPNGWFKTGDRGHFTQSGEVLVTGRDSDLIITGGENVDPVEVELALVQVPGVSATAVVGVDDARFGQLVFALVVASAGAPRSIEALRAELAGKLAPFKQPRGLAFVNELPLLQSGKLDRRAAHALAARAIET